MSWFALAEFSEGAGAEAQAAERRGAPRRRLQLESVLTTRRPPQKTVVLDLSEAGLMLHAYDDLAVDETFELLLSDAGPVEAQVVWKRNQLYGCKFLTPVTRAMISAALLKARPGPPAPAETAPDGR